MIPVIRKTEIHNTKCKLTFSKVAKVTSHCEEKSVGKQKYKFTMTFKPMCTLIFKPIVLTSNNLTDAHDLDCVLEIYIKILEDVRVTGQKEMPNR